MVEHLDNGFVDNLFELVEVDDHAVGIELAALAVDGDDPVVAMQVAALAGIGEVQLVASCHLDAFGDVVHA